jgi:hypothetical protein
MSGSSTINSASVFAVPNSLVARDRFSSTWINGIIMKGANYVASNINRDLTKNGYLYFYSTDVNKFAMLRNISSVPNDIHVSFDIGKSKTDGKFSIRNLDNTVTPNVAKTLFTVTNGKVAIGTDTPLDDFHVKGNSRFEDDVNVFGDLKINGRIIYTPSPIDDPENNDVVTFGQLEDFVQTKLESFPGVTGPEGDQGPQGVQGFQGPEGNQGPGGAQGPQGNPGPPGGVGPTGVQGPSGVQGPVGPTGPQGNPGGQGIPGPQNLTGLAAVYANLSSSTPSGGSEMFYYDPANNIIALRVTSSTGTYSYVKFQITPI